MGAGCGRSELNQSWRVGGAWTDRKRLMRLPGEFRVYRDVLVRVKSILGHAAWLIKWLVVDHG